MIGHSHKYIRLQIFFIVIAILVLNYSKAFASSRFGATMTQIEMFEKSLEKLYEDIGRHPTSNEGLNLLFKNETNVSGWNGRYTNKAVLPLDGWGNKYIYIYPVKYGNSKYDLYSFGKNQTDDFGEKDDITNWKEIDYTYYKRSVNERLRIIIPNLIKLIVLFILIYFCYRLHKSSSNRKARKPNG